MIEALTNILLVVVMLAISFGGIVALWQIHRWFFYDRIYNSLNVIIYKLENKGK